MGNLPAPGSGSPTLIKIYLFILVNNLHNISILQSLFYLILEIEQFEMTLYDHLVLQRKFKFKVRYTQEFGTLCNALTL